MAWQDRLSRWLDQQVERRPALDGWLESHLHAYGIHGPEARHLLKARVLPTADLVLAALLLLAAVLLVRYAVRSRARRRPQPGR